MPLAAGNIIFPLDLILSGIAKSHIWLSAFWYHNEMGYISTEDKGILEGQN